MPRHGDDGTVTSMELTNAGRNEMLRVVIRSIGRDETPRQGRAAAIAVRACTAVDYIVGLITLSRHGDRTVRDQLRAHYRHRLDEFIATNGDLDADEADDLSDRHLDVLTDLRQQREQITSPLLDRLADDPHLAGRRTGLIIDWATAAAFEPDVLAHLVDRAATELDAQSAYDTLSCLERHDDDIHLDVLGRLAPATAAILARCTPDRWTTLETLRSSHSVTRHHAEATDSDDDTRLVDVDLETLTVTAAGGLDTATSRAVVAAIDAHLDRRDELWDSLWLLTPTDGNHLSVAALCDNICTLHVAA